MPDLAERALAWAEGRPTRIRGHNPWEIAVRTWREIIDDRVPGLAAEMAFFALLSLAPLLVATGAALGYLERVLGGDQIERMESTVLDGLSLVFSSELTDDVIGPLVRGLLYEERGGIAIISLAVTLWLASRVFTATIRALDLAYDIDDQRNLVAQRAVAIALALAAVVVVALTLVVIVVGPLLGGGHALAARLRLGDAFALAWSIGRWPLLVVIMISFLSLVYYVAPNVESRWRDSLPGAAVGVALLFLVAAGFRLYLEVGAGQNFEFADDAAAAAAGRFLGAVVAGVLWIYLSSMALLVGGEVNAELTKSRERHATRGFGMPRWP